MDIPSIIDHNYYVVKSTTTGSAWICEAERFDDKVNRLYYYYGTYELSSEEHKNNCYLSNSHYDILPNESDEIRLATMEDIDILMDILEKNGVVTTLQEAGDKAKAPNLKGEDYSNKRFGYKIPDGYEFDVVVDGKIFLTPIKPKYPETYKECCGILGMTYDYPDIKMVSIDECNLYSNFIELVRCRNAYWKIAGEEMGLENPWEHDYLKDANTIRYAIYNTGDEIAKLDGKLYRNYILSFPTEEMRDAFYENFKDLIESCKELL